MKKIITITLLLASVFTQAQRFDWVTTAGYSGVANGSYGALAIARDSQGNLYTLDGANGQQECQGITAEPFSGGVTTFLYKFNALGELQYIKPIGVNFIPLNIQVGENDNLYLLGALVGGSVLIVDGVTINGIENRNYILKFDPSGSLLWNVPNNESFGGHSTACMLQFYDNHIYFQSGRLSITKLDTNGQYVSTLTADSFIPNTAINGIYFKGSGVFSNGDLLFTAGARGILTYDTITLVPIVVVGSVSLLMLRTSDSLTVTWAKYVDGMGDPAENFIPVTIGNDDGIYVGVEVNSTLVAGSDTLGPGTDGILKLDENGTPVWLKSVTTNAHAWSVLNNPDGSGVFCAGEFIGALTLGNFTINAINGSSFIAKIDYDGTFKNAFAFAAGPGSKTRSMATNNGGVFYVGGKLFSRTVSTFSGTPRDAHAGLYLGKFTEEPDVAPQPTISVAGRILTSAPVFNGSIQWFLNGVSIPGATSQIYTITANGNYTVAFSYIPAIVSVSGAKFTEEPDVAPQPTITVSGGVLTASPVFNGSIQWFLNGDSIGGAINQTYTVVVNGNYTVAYSYIPEIVAVSGVTLFLTVGIADNRMNSFSIYPNPFRNEITIEFDKFTEPGTITICDYNGRKLVQKEISGSSQTFDMRTFSDGVYIFQFQNTKGVITKRIIKSY